MAFDPADTESWCCLMSKYFGRSSPAIISFCVNRRSGDVAWIDNSAICGKAEKKHKKHTSREKKELSIKFNLQNNFSLISDGEQKTTLKTFIYFNIHTEHRVVQMDDNNLTRKKKKLCYCISTKLNSISSTFLWCWAMCHFFATSALTSISIQMMAYYVYLYRHYD